MKKTLYFLYLAAFMSAPAIAAAFAAPVAVSVARPVVIARPAPVPAARPVVTAPAKAVVTPTAATKNDVRPMAPTSTNPVIFAGAGSTPVHKRSCNDKDKTDCR